MSEKRLLQVGDMIYETNGNHWKSRFKVDRVTEKSAFYKTMKIKREFDDTITPIPQQTWIITEYYIETPERKIEFENQLILSKLTKFNFSVLTPDQRHRILDIIKEGV